MCKALVDMRNRCREEGWEDGRKEGWEDGRKEGRKEGREEGKGEVFWDMAQYGMELEKIAEITKRSTEAVYECLKKIAEEKKMPMPLL